MITHWSQATSKVIDSDDCSLIDISSLDNEQDGSLLFQERLVQHRSSPIWKKSQTSHSRQQIVEILRQAYGQGWKPQIKHYMPATRFGRHQWYVYFACDFSCPLRRNSIFQVSCIELPKKEISVSLFCQIGQLRWNNMIDMFIDMNHFGCPRNFRLWRTWLNSISID